MKNELDVSVYDDRGGDVMAEAREFPIEELKLLSVQGKHGLIYTLNLENVYRILTRHPKYKGRFRYDRWVETDQIFENKEWRDVEDCDFLELQSELSIMYPQFRQIKKTTVQDGVFLTCRRNSIDTVKDKICALAWDNVPRIDTWLSTVYGVEDNAYHRAVGSNWIKGLILRITRPGSQFDSVIILKGKQGCGKSTSLKVLGDDLHAETTMKADNKDFLMLFRGKAIIEFSEGHTLSQTETQQMKSIISTRADRYRDPYARMMKDRLRRCVFALTTNQDRPLKDETGNRRYFPIDVVCDFANIEWIKENKEQMFAEALYRIEKLKETVHEYPKEAEDIQNSNVEESPYEEKVSSWLNNPRVYDNISGVSYTADLGESGVLITDVWENALGGQASRIDWRATRNLTQAMKACGMERVRRMQNGRRCWRWILRK